VYENALAIEIRKNKLQVIQQHPIPVRYEGAVVGEFVADLFVQDEILVELKTVKALDEIHLAQCLHYLKAHRLARVFIDQFWKPKGGNQTHHVMNLSPHLCLSVSICG
jgi:GxxExxY protein